MLNRLEEYPHQEILDLISNSKDPTEKNLLKLAISTQIWESLRFDEENTADNEEYFQDVALCHALAAEVSQSELTGAANRILQDRAKYTLSTLEFFAARISGDIRGCVKAKALLDELLAQGKRVFYENHQPISLPEYRQHVEYQCDEVIKDNHPNPDLYNQLTPSSLSDLLKVSEKSE